MFRNPPAPPTSLLAPCIVLFSVFCFSPAAHAGYTLTDVTANPGDWTSAITGLTVSGTADLGVLPDFGGTGINGPITSAGSGIIPAAFIPNNITITTDLAGSGGTQPLLFGLGPSIGAGNPVNTILVNDSGDAMVIDFATSVQAFEFSYVSWLGGGPVTIDVTNDLNVTTTYSGLSAPIAGGNRYGILGTGPDKIKSIRLHDTGAGFEGFTGSFNSFQSVPEPASIVLLSFGVACCGMRRRKR